MKRTTRAARRKEKTLRRRLAAALAALSAASVLSSVLPSAEAGHVVFPDDPYRTIQTGVEHTNPSCSYTMGGTFGDNAYDSMQFVFGNVQPTNHNIFYNDTYHKGGWSWYSALTVGQYKQALTAAENKLTVNTTRDIVSPANSDDYTTRQMAAVWGNQPAAYLLAGCGDKNPDFLLHSLTAKNNELEFKNGKLATHSGYGGKLYGAYLERFTKMWYDPNDNEYHYDTNNSI